MSEQETTETKDSTPLSDASMNASPDETFWQRLMREFDEFFYTEEKPKHGI